MKLVEDEELQPLRLHAVDARFRGNVSASAAATALRVPGTETRATPPRA